MNNKLITSRILLVIIAICIFPAMKSQIRFGVKAGININTLHLNEKIGEELTNSDNRAGFTGGIMAEFNLPVVGLGIDASALYARRSDDLGSYSDNEVLKRDYFTFPINLKYKLTLPIVNQIIKPFATTGPEFSFLVNDNFDKFNLQNTFDSKKMSTAWNVGFGLEIVNKLQLHANYSIGLTKALDAVGITSSDYNSEKYQTRGKDKYWTVTAAYLF